MRVVLPKTASKIFQLFVKSQICHFSELLILVTINRNIAIFNFISHNAFKFLAHLSRRLTGELLCKEIHFQRKDTYPTVIPRILRAR